MENDILQRITVLETRFEERWDSHDQRSQEQWGEIKTNLKSICGKIDALLQRPCDIHTDKLKQLDVALGRMWAIITGIILAILASWLKGATP